MDHREKLKRARDKVAALTGFYIHLSAFGLIMIILFVINVSMDPDWWVQWPLMGWGIGILAHALAVFGEVPRSVRNWQLRKIHMIRARM